MSKILGIFLWKDFFFSFTHSLSSEEDHVMEAASSWQFVAEGKPFSHCSVTINIWIRNRKKLRMLRHKQYASFKWACESTAATVSCRIKRWSVFLLREINTFYFFLCNRIRRLLSTWFTLIIHNYFHATGI